MPKQQFSENAFDVLRYLKEVAVSEGGWFRRGVRGWVFTNEFPLSLPAAPSYLQTLARRGFVDREPVTDPFQKIPVYLYRITAFGSMQLVLHDENLPTNGEAAFVADPVAEQTDVERETIFISRRQWRALEFLKQQEKEGTYAASDIIDGTGGQWIDIQDLVLLESKTLVKSEKLQWRRRFSATSVGRTVQPIDTESGQHFVAIHVPGGLASAASRKGDKTPSAQRTGAPGYLSGG